MTDAGAGGGGRAADGAEPWAVPGGHRRRGWVSRRRMTLFVTAGVLAVVAAGVLAWGVWDRVDPSSYRTYWVPSPAMEPTYSVGDIVRTRDIDGDEAERGDVLIVDAPEGSASEVTMLIKRVVAVGGDEVAPGPGGAVLVNGEVLDEPYLAPGTATEAVTTQDVPDGHLFVLGDNRTNSADSRVFGPVPEADVVALVLD